MKELNRETADNIKAGFNLMINFSYVDNATPLILENLSLSNFYSSDYWLDFLMRMLFINNSRKISQYLLDDIADIVEILEYVDSVDETNTFGYEWHYINFLNEYEYYSCDEEVETSDEYLEDYLGYFKSLGINVLKLYSPIVCEFDGLDMKGFIDKIPYLVGDYYDIRRRDLLACRVERYGEFNVISIYYFNDDYGDLYVNIDTEYTYDEFLNAIKLYTSASKNKERVM